MKRGDIVEIIEEGIMSNRTVEEIAGLIASRINDEWYYKRKDKAEVIIE